MMKTTARPAAKAADGRSAGAAATAILEIAEKLVQSYGYNGFSYADVAVELGVTKASLHYHFQTKEALGRALIERYSSSFSAALESISRSGRSPLGKLKRYVALYDSVLRDERMCLCGMLAAEYSTLPDRMQAALRDFFDVNERWLAAILREGRELGELAYKETPLERARVLLSTLQGAMLIARSYRQPRRFKLAAQQLLEALE